MYETIALRTARCRRGAELHACVPPTCIGRAMFHIIIIEGPRRHDIANISEKTPPPPPGEDPGFRRGVVHSEGGGRTGISGADPNCCRALGKSTSKQKNTAVGGGGFRSPPKNLYPRLPPPPMLYVSVAVGLHLPW